MQDTQKLNVEVDKKVVDRVNKVPEGPEAYIERLVKEDIQHQQGKEQIAEWENEGGSPPVLPIAGGSANGAPS